MSKALNIAVARSQTYVLAMLKVNKAGYAEALLFAAREYPDSSTAATQVQAWALVHNAQLLKNRGLLGVTNYSRVTLDGHREVYVLTDVFNAKSTTGGFTRVT